MNLYNGKTFGSLFATYPSSKPFFISEWGCDSFDGRIGAPNEAMHSEYIKSQWQDISAHLSHMGKTESCIGGCVFEWCDEWWGIVGIDRDSYARTPKKVYYILAGLWGGRNA